MCKQVVLTRDQLGALERFFGGCRDRVVAVYQQPGSDRMTMCAGPLAPPAGEIGVALSLAEVEALIVEHDATGAPIRLAAQ